MTTASAQSLPITGVWSIDALHSTVGFSVRHHAVATFSSGFSQITGAYDGDQRRLTGEVRAENITLTGLDRLKGHILTPDFFDAESHPVFRFASAELRQDGEQLAVEGELTLRGTTRPVSATGAVRGPLTVRHGDGHITDRLGIDLATTIDRRDFGIVFNTQVAEGVFNLGWDVSITARLELYLADEQ